jgi:hypothetical protein
VSIIEILFYIFLSGVIAVLNNTGNVMSCDVTLRPVRATNVAVEMQKLLHILSVGLWR